MLSGGSVRSLKMMSSNILGLSMFSSGLSSLQIQKFRAHHLIGTVMAENIPQLAMQGFFMFHLNLCVVGHQRCALAQNGNHSVFGQSESPRNAVHHLAVMEPMWWIGGRGSKPCSSSSFSPIPSSNRSSK